MTTSHPSPLFCSNLVAGFLLLLVVILIVRIRMLKNSAEMQRRAELVLDRRAQEFRSLAEHLPDVVSRIDRQGRHLYVNRRIESFTGLPQAAFIGKTNKELGMPQDVQATWDETCAHVFASGQPGVVSFDFPAPSGLLNLESLLIPEFGPDGDVATLLCICRDITDRKRALNAVRESEERLRVIFETSDSGIILVSPQGVIEFANGRMAEMLGMSPQELLGTFYADHLHAAEKTVGDMRMHQLIQSEVRSVTHERRYIRKDGTDFWGYLSGRRLENQDGSLRSLVGVITDISDRKQAEEALSYSVSLTNATLESTPDGILIVDRSGRIARWNQKFTDLWRVPQELLGAYIEDEPVLSHVTAQMDRPQEFLARVRELYAHPEASSVDTLYLADGRVFERYSQPQRIGADIVGRFWSFRDVTERKRMVQALAENENRLRTVVQTIPDLIWLKDADGVYLSCNRIFERLFGARETEIIGKTDYDFVDRELADFFRQHDRKAMEAGRPSINEEWVTFADDDHDALLETIKTPMYDTEGKLIGVLGIARDITQRKELEKEQLKVEKLESLGVLAGGIAHDFNNILTGIMGNISFALMCLDPTHKIFKRLIEAEKASLRAGELAQQLLTFARGGEPVKRVVSIQHLVHESVSLLLRGSAVKGIVDIPASLHAIEADEGQISQVFNNIIINAKQAMSTGGTLTVSARNEKVSSANTLGLAAGMYIRISFADEGCGIAADDLNKIFDPYFTTKSAGNGLGLASAHSVITRHGGNICAASTIGKGTTFTIRLPSVGEVCTGDPAYMAMPVAGVHQGGSVLVMDDEELIRNLATELLEYLGYQVTTCVDGAEAVAHYIASREAKMPFAAVVMDLTIPGGMGGSEAARRILAVDPEACLIVSSGYSHDPIMSDYKIYGFSAAVAKPYSVQKFGELLGELLAGR